jgi:glycosyltransferase involved in cell wall biosynthesis
MFDFERARIALVGPLPPPPGGMANQTEQLARFLGAEGAEVTLVQTNAPYRPSFVRYLRGFRAGFRLVPFLERLRAAAREATLFHVMANSGWAYHLFAAPAVNAARRAGVPVILNYRGGNAERFFARSFPIVARSLSRTNAIVVPSDFLKGVFGKLGFDVDVVPNVVDLERFRPRDPASANGAGPKLLVARHLESIYDVATALRAFALVREKLPQALLDVAGSGPEAELLRRLRGELELGDSVRFLGPVPNERMPGVYESADLVLNSSLVDNMPNSLLEALASGLPIVSTNVGGVPALVEDGKEAVLVPPGNPGAMADAVVSLWQEPSRRAALRQAGLEKASRFGWSSVRAQWANVYARASAN